MLEQDAPVNTRPRNDVKSRSWVIGLTSLFFILLQSACTAFMAISGLRLLIGIGSLAAATTGMNLLASIHGGAIRIPMEIVAVAGSVINLLCDMARKVVARPTFFSMASRSSASNTRRAEWIQVALAILTLVLVAIEWVIHIRLRGSI